MNIRKFTLLTVLFSFPLFLFSGCASQKNLLDPRTAKFPLQSFTVPDSSKFTLSNGIKVHLVTDHELPLVGITAYIKTGSVYEPADKAGLASLTGSIMRSGGTLDTPVEKLDEELEFMASSVESSIGADVGNVSMTTLKKNLPRTLELFSQVLVKPAFRQDRLELAKKQSIEGLRRQNDDPKWIADRELSRALYEGHPLGNLPAIKGIESISRDDIADFHKRYFAPKDTILAVSGDVDMEELRWLLENYLGGWKVEAAVYPEILPPSDSIAPKVLYAKKAVNQSVIRMGHPGIDKNNPDLYSLRVLDYILGIGFTSRLMNEVRSNQGLAYHVDGYFDIGRRFRGTYRASTETRSDATVKAVRLMKDIIAKVTKELVTDEELSLAKDSIINSFVFGFAKPDAVVNQRARLDYYGYPAGYLENYRDNISKVGKEDIKNAASKWLKPESFTIVVVGDEKKFDKPLSELGTVKELSLEIK